MDDALKNLINKLTPGEKKNFSFFSKLINSSEYLTLFNHILKYKNVNLEKLNKEIKDKSFFKYISAKKDYLLNKILLSLVYYKFENSYSWNIIKNVLFIKILIEKGFIEKANKLIISTKELAYKYEEFDVILELISLEEFLCFKYSYIVNYNNLKNLKKERKKIFDIIENYNDLQMVKAELQQFQLDEHLYSSNVSSFIEKYGYSPIISKKEIKSIKAQSIWFYIIAAFQYIQNNYDKAFIIIKQHYELFKKYPELFTKNEYIQLFNNFLYCCCLTKNSDVFNQLANDFLNLKNLSIEESTYVNIIYYCRKLELLHRINDYKNAEILSLEAYSFLEKNNHNVEELFIQYLKMLIIRAFIENKNFLQANIFIQKIYNSIGYEFKSSIFKLFEFIVYYKLGYYEVLLSSIDSWIKTIHKKRKPFPIEKIIIKYFRSVCNTDNIESKKELLIKVIKELRIIEKSNIKYSKHHDFDFAAWFERELEEMNNNC